jgi:hypothetical protein
MSLPPLLLSLLLPLAWAHAPDTSLSVVRPIADGASVVLTLRARDADALGSVDPGLLAVSAGGQPCDPSGVGVSTLSDGRVEARWSVVCPGPVDGLDASVLLGRLPRHLLLARVGERSAGLTRVAPALGPAAPARGLVAMGARHLLEGWDHVAFLGLLVLVPATLGRLAWSITGFTLGHSLALLLAGLGLVSPVGVEVLIAWSIAALAAEGVWVLEGRVGRGLPLLLAASPLALSALPGGPPLPASIGASLFMACHLALIRRSAASSTARIRATAFFGLLHGFGFAGALGALGEVGLLRGVLGFNLGVELGQLAALLLLVPLVAGLRRWAPERAPRMGAALGVGVGVFAMLSRGLG